MSQVELARLLHAFATDPSLRQEFDALGNADAQVAWAFARGYRITPAEAASLSVESLSDDDLENVAGGWSGGG